MGFSVLDFFISGLIRRFVFFKRREFRLRTNDRFFLESRIFPALHADKEVKDILFVGCHEYSWWYFELFPQFLGKNFYICEPEFENPRLRSYRNFHKVTLKELDSGLDSRFDVIVINGVLNYGIDSEEDFELAVTKVLSLLKCGGRLILGYRKVQDEAFFRFPRFSDSFEPVETIKGFPLVIDLETGNGHCFKSYRPK